MSDFATAGMPEGWQGRIRASVHVEPLDGGTRPVVATSVEVFAADAGRSVLFYPGAFTLCATDSRRASATILQFVICASLQSFNSLPTIQPSCLTNAPALVRQACAAPVVPRVSR